MDRAIIETRGLTKRFKKLTAVNQVDVTIYEGEYIALLGPNGAGKTTFVEMIEGVLEPSEGVVYIDGKSWREDEKELRNILGVSFQETRFMDKVTVYETLSLFAGFYGVSKERVEELLNEGGLISKRDTYVVNLSGGQRQKLAIAIALVNSPRIILLDEPTTGLDPRARREIWELLLRLKKSGTTMILTTHYMEEAEFLCDRIFMMNEGKILACGTLDELLEGESERSTVEVEFKYEVPEEVCKMGGALVDESRPVVRVASDHPAEVLKEMLGLVESADIRDISVGSMTLEDLFIQMTGRGLGE